ncbi:MAG: methyltransferase domain-containing protein [Acidimicrobiia bacterium]|nr:methyltransferase domain-containing protein [Acidimicrobiia bacterium]
MVEQDPPITPPEIIAHYDRYDESSRLAEESFGILERLRTQHLLERTLPAPPATIVDIGSGPGVYSVWLAQRGYTVHAIDPVPHHVDQALERAAASGVMLASATVADARAVALETDTANAVLLMGPLYHLQERGHRLAALAEAHRVVRPGGVIAAAAIGRFASTIDGLDRGFIDDPAFSVMVEEAIATGRHHNPTNDPAYFTTAYFHLADELTQELVDAGFEHVAVHAVEGIAWLAPDFADRLADPQRRAKLLDLMDRVASEPSIIGVSPHLLAIGTAG